MLQLIIQGTLAIMVVNIVVVIYFVHRKVTEPKRARKLSERKARSYELIDILYGAKGRFVLSHKNLRRIKKLLSIEFMAMLYDDPKYSNHKRLQQIFNLLGFGKRMHKMLKSSLWWKQALSANLAGRTVHQGAVPALLELLNTSKNLDVILNSGEALLQINSGEHYCFVVDRFTQSHLISYRQILTILLHQDDDDFHLTILNHAKEQPLYRRLALEMLSAQTDQRVIPLITESLIETNREVIISSLKAVDNLSLPVDAVTEEQIAALHNHTDWQVRSFVAKALEYCNESQFGTLKDLMRDPNWYVRYNAAISLANKRDSGCLCLAGMLMDSDRFARDMAWQILHRTDRGGLAETTVLRIEELELNYQIANKPGVIPI